jgi:putative copper export protein/methionine-rich copper-binding protein CopC
MITPRRRSLAVAGVLGLVIGVLCSIQLVYAHALLVRSTPEAGAELAIAPASLELWFSEPLEANFSNIHLVDAAGNEFGRGASVVDQADHFHMSLPLSDLSPGIYTVVWRTLSEADGHEWVGSFPLTLLNPDGTRPAGAGQAAVPLEQESLELPTPFHALTRWLALSGAMLLFGLLFLSLQLRPIGATNGDELVSFTAAAQQSLAIALLTGAAALILSGWLHVADQVLDMDQPSQVRDLIFATRSGNLILIRQFLASVILLGALVSILPAAPAKQWRPLTGFAALYAILLLVAVGWLVSQRPQLFVMSGAGLGLAGILAAFLPAPVQGKRVAMTWLLLLLAFCVLITFSVSSHAAAVMGSGWAILADLIHLVAAAIWFGGLVVLALLLWQMRLQRNSADLIALRQTVARFSAIATLAVFFLAVTGIFSSFVQLQAFGQLWTTVYGRVLIAKLVLVAVTMGLALLNHRFVHGPPAAKWTTADRPFLQRVWGEATVSLVLMLVVAVLVQTPVPLPPAMVASTPQNTIFQEILAVDDLSIHLQISPNQVGNNLYQAHLYHDDGSSIGEVQLVRLFFVHEGGDLGQSSLDLAAQGGGLFGAEGAYQNRAGAWEVSVYVRRRGLDDSLVKTTVMAPEPAASAPVANQPWQNPISAWPPDTPIVGLVITVSIAVALWRGLTRKTPVA